MIEKHDIVDFKSKDFTPENLYWGRDGKAHSLENGDCRIKDKYGYIHTMRFKNGNLHGICGLFNNDVDLTNNLPRAEDVFRDGKLVRHSFYLRDAEGNLKRQTDYNYDENGNVTGTENREYDENGNVISSCIHDNEGNLIISTEYTYDKKGNLIRK